MKPVREFGHTQLKAENTPFQAPYMAKGIAARFEYKQDVSAETHINRDSLYILQAIDLYKADNGSIAGTLPGSQVEGN